MRKPAHPERSLLLLSAVTLAVGLPTAASWARVSGACGNCHTMHNSQDGQPIMHSGAGAGWAADGSFNTGAATDAPAGYLLITDCVGCHSSTTADQTIVELGPNRIPIVFNTSGYPINALAGGNFYQVSQGEAFDGYGHNVYGISEHDTKLSAAPGNTRCSGTASSCHITLAVAPDEHNYDRGGCQGCHFSVFHHQENEEYRFLNSHDEPQGAYVQGVEHDSWEHPEHTTATDHNFYKGVDKTANGGHDGVDLRTTHSISSYCAGCHNTFHNNDGTGTDAWLRHPTDIALPEEGEYAQYNPVTGYEIQSPVAWINPSAPQRDEAIVMCLSCHRVHGSKYPDILRWDYSGMIANEPNDDGCFVCHTTKD